jgi:hypothetical protein
LNKSYRLIADPAKIDRKLTISEKTIRLTASKTHAVMLNYPLMVAEEKGFRVLNQQFIADRTAAIVENILRESYREKSLFLSTLKKQSSTVKTEEVKSRHEWNDTS